MFSRTIIRTACIGRGNARLRSIELRRGSLRTRRLAWPKQAKPAKAGGARRDRTDDLMLAKHALSQLSYGPVPEDEMLALSRSLRRKFCHARLRPFWASPGTLRSTLERGCATRSRRRSVVGLGRLELPTSRLSSARSNQLSYKPEPFATRRAPH